MKPETRIIAWDDCGFTFDQQNVQVIGAVFRGGQYLDGLLSTTIEKDGIDVTEKIVKSIKTSRQYDQLSYIMTDGISFGGLNILDINTLYEETKLPVIAVVRRNPDREAFIEALEKFPDAAQRKEIVKNTGKVESYKKLFYQRAGLEKKECEEIIDATVLRSHLPEPIRVAHIIASGLSGESRGGA